MKLSEWAKEKGISYRTAHRMFKAGTLPVEYEQLPTGTILVYPDNITASQAQTVLYARVSSHDQKADLERQMNRLKDFTAAKGLSVVVDLVTSMCARIYGRRLAGNRAKKALKAIEEP